MKKRIRSRSRSRSLSPLHNRERNHTREYQNQRGFRGNHRGFRRPYYFRGRGQGFFRGRFQRGGRGGYHNYHPKNWQNFRQNNYQQQQQHHPTSPKRGRPHSRSPKKLSNSSKSRSHSRRSDGSSSGRSPQSHHSSSSNSVSAKRKCKDASIVLSEGTQGGDGALAEPVVGSSTAKEDVDGNETLEDCCNVLNNDASPKRISLQVDPETNQTTSAQKSSNSLNKSGVQTNLERVPLRNSPLKKTSYGFGLFSNVAQETDGSVDISSAFLKFLEDQKNKKRASALENATHKRKNNGDIEHATGNRFVKGLELSHIIVPDKAEEKSTKNGDVNKSRSTTRKAQPSSPSFLCEDDEEKEIPEWLRDSKVALSTREMFEKHVLRMQDIAWDEGVEAANILAALSKRDKLSTIFKDHSPEKHSNVKRKENPKPSSSAHLRLIPRRGSENREQEMFVVMNEESPLRASLKRESGELGVDSLSDDLARTSVLSGERRNLLDFVNLDKKDWEFQCLLWQLYAQQIPRSPSELFSQHIVSIVHHIKAQYFPSSELTLSDRFGMYQRRAEKESLKQPKSPEIHRRIDVSPSAFKKHSLLFDEMKSSMENNLKVGGKKSKGDSMDLRLAIERRKKYLSGEREPREEESCKYISLDASSKNHKQTKKSQTKRECSPSSSSSPSSSEEEGEIKAESFSKIHQSVREYREDVDRGRARGGFLRMRGRSWNRGHFHASNGHSHLTGTNEGWDQEYSLKSKKHILQSGKDGEIERKSMDSSGRGLGNFVRTKGRFILRRATTTNTSNKTSPKWVHDKFQATDDEAELQQVDGEQDQ
ncbi:hypothetical protein DNTS_029881 [Danionella cerebrum]|uniref:Btz domain-containing protein n=1 Tax=Danionella cerebrum TaxID=2873325 RepID=A0A553RLL8_9TELE|nr:hypothetical protein DNTS_029881 [Danionella translucida]